MITYASAKGWELYTPGQRVRQSHSGKKIHKHRPPLACLVSSNIYSTPNRNIIFTSIVSFLRSKTLVALGHVCVDGVSSNQNSFKSRREELSIHVPTMGNGCIVWHCQRTWSKSSQYVLCCQRFLLFSMVACGEKKSNCQIVNVYFSSNALSVRRPVSLHNQNRLNQQWLCFVSQICRHQICV